MRLWDDPAPIVLVMFGVIAAWKSYPCLGDLGLGMALLSCFPEHIDVAETFWCMPFLFLRAHTGWCNDTVVKR